MRISNNGINLIKQWEGLKLKAYKCSAGVSTIGIGTTRYPNGLAVKMGDTITEAQAIEYFKHDIKAFEQDIARYVKVPLTQNQYDALVSFIYNVGAKAFSTSTMLKRINECEYDRAAAEFVKWSKAGGKVILGLVNRRKAERDLFSRP